MNRTLRKREMPYLVLARKSRRHPAVPWVWKPGMPSPAGFLGLGQKWKGCPGKRLQGSLILRVTEHYLCRLGMGPTLLRYFCILKSEKQVKLSRIFETYCQNVSDQLWPLL